MDNLTDEELRKVIGNELRRLQAKTKKKNRKIEMLNGRVTFLEGRNSDLQDEVSRLAAPGMVEGQDNQILRQEIARLRLMMERQNKRYDALYLEREAGLQKIGVMRLALREQRQNVSIFSRAKAAVIKFVQGVVS
jgi:hypothetical protein